jgi:hypothetical protein|tara:strand:+ start:274 stop:453 length:180 start_codon:yes stop_codon:yes gene_type:complete
MIRSSLQDRKLLKMIRSELDVTINSFGLKIRKLENENRSFRGKIIQLEKKVKNLENKGE